MSQYTADVQARDGYIFVEVGPLDETKDEPWFQFGMTAELRVSAPGWGLEDREVKVTVSMGAIGSHDRRTAQVRAHSYWLVITLACAIESFLKMMEDAWTWPTLAEFTRVKLMNLDVVI